MTLPSSSNMIPAASPNKVACLAIVLALVAILAPLASAADKKTEEEAHALYEPRSSPGSGQEFLKRFVGEWRVTKKFYPPTGEAVETTGKCTQIMIHDGRFLKSEFTFGEGNAATTGLGIVGYDPKTDKFTSFWTDSRSTRISIRESEAPFKGSELVLFSRSLDEDAKDKGRRSKTVTRFENQGSEIVHRQYSQGPAQEDRLMMELTLKRADAFKQAK